MDCHNGGQFNNGVIDIVELGIFADVFFCTLFYDLFIPETGDKMIIDHAYCLHMGIDNG